MSTDAHTPWYRLPFAALWRVATGIERRIGIVRCLLLGAALTVVGLVCCLTFVGVLVGLPMILLGSAMVLRGLI